MIAIARLGLVANVFPGIYLVGALNNELQTYFLFQENFILAFFLA